VVFLDASAIIYLIEGDPTAQAAVRDTFLFALASVVAAFIAPF